MKNKWLTFTALALVAVMMNASMNAQRQNGKNANSTNSTKSEKSIDMTWIEMGPSNLGGRTRALLIDKNNPNTLYAGAIAGGLWKSTSEGTSWSKIAGSDMLDNMAVSCLYQSPNGDLYYGTGEYFGYDNTLGIKGKGIWKSTDNGATWLQLSSTNNDDFCYVSKITGTATKLYAATYKGIRVSTDGGTTWTNPIDSTDANYNKPATDIETSSDGSVVVASLNNYAYVCNTGNDVFVLKSGAGSIATDVIRLEFSIAPGNNNYIYCLAVNADGKLDNVYKSTDKGNTWSTMIANVTNQFQPFGLYKNKQGRFECSIAASPVDPEVIYIGGIDLYRYTPANSFEQLTLFDLPTYSSKYLHKNIHVIKFSPNFAVDSTIFVGTDGGVFRSTDQGESWARMCHNYNTMNFTSVGISSDNKVLGGTINNGLLYNDLTGTASTDFKQYTFSDFSSGVIGSVERSLFNPDDMIATAVHGRIYNSNDGSLFELADTNIASVSISNVALEKLGTDSEALFNPVRIFDNFYDTSSTQTVLFKADTTYCTGDTIKLFNPYKRTLLHIVTPADFKSGDTCIAKKDTIYIKDTYQSLAAVGLNKHVWISWEATNPSYYPPVWFPVENNSSVRKIQELEFSGDGNIIYFSDYDTTSKKSNVYRLSNLQSARDSLTAYYTSNHNAVSFQKIGTFCGKINGLAVDPENNNNLLVTLSDYNSPCHIYFCANSSIHSEAEILNFSIPNQIGTSTIVSSDSTIKVVMPYGTDLSNLTPTITVSEGATITPASGVHQNFTTPVSYLVTAQDTTIKKNWKVTVTLAAINTDAKILTFSIPNQIGASIITDSTVKITMPYGTDLTNLTPTITISNSATINPASGVPQDFTNPVYYVVTAQDTTVKKNWKVTVRDSIPSSEVKILSFTFPKQEGASIINYNDGTIHASIYGSVTNITPTITISDHATINPASGVHQDFTNPVYYTVTAQDGTTAKLWTATVTGADTPSSEADILTFSIPNQVGTSVINSDSVFVVMPYGTVLTSLTPTITISNSATINPKSGVHQNFTTPVHYLVTAQDTTITKNWIVKVTHAANTEAKILTFTIPNQLGTSVITDSTVKITMPKGTDLTNLTPTITVSTGATINPLSGTPQDFTNPVSYVVTAQDTTIKKNWIVTIVAPDTAAKILTFSIPNQIGASIITDSTVKITMPYGTNLTNLTPTITVSNHATINPHSGVHQDFTNPVSYVVTAQDTTIKKSWVVTVSDTTPNLKAEILAFSIPGQVRTNVIRSNNGTVTVFMPYGTNLTNLTPTITVSNGATINPHSGVPQDFTNPVSYVVTAQDTTIKKNWTVTVSYNATPNIFSEKQGNFANIPIYSAIFLWNNSHHVILGTEQGIWATEDITAASPTWVEENNGMARVPVSQIRQQIHPNGWMHIPGYVNNGLQTDVSNQGVIYAATMGRGIFRCETFRAPVNVPENNLTTQQNLINVYPNPTQDIANVSIELKSNSPVQISILNINGQLVSTKKWNRLSKGNQTLQIPVSNLSSGFYILSVKSNNGVLLGKLIKN